MPQPAPARTSYAEKLKDPRWQRKRLEILERDGWACVLCDDATNTLHVHHWYYTKGKEPWEYPARALATLCESCHAQEEERRPEAESVLVAAFRAAGFSAADLEQISEAMFTLAGRAHFQGYISLAVHHLIQSPDLVEEAVQNWTASVGRVRHHYWQKFPGASKDNDPSDTHLIYAGLRQGNSTEDLMALVDLVSSRHEWYMEMTALLPATPREG